MYSSTVNAAAVQHNEMNAIVSAEAECLTIATSQGQVLVLSSNRLEALGVQDSVAAEEESAVESAVLSSHQLRAEPRLAAVVSWNPAAAAVLAGE